MIKAALEMGHSEDEAMQYFQGLDLDGNGYIDFDELTIAYDALTPKVISAINCTPDYLKLAVHRLLDVCVYHRRHLKNLRSGKED